MGEDGGIQFNGVARLEAPLLSIDIFINRTFGVKPLYT
jgi:hypothetical protein